MVVGLGSRSDTYELAPATHGKAPRADTGLERAAALLVDEEEQLGGDPVSRVAGTGEGVRSWDGVVGVGDGEEAVECGVGLNDPLIGGRHDVGRVIEGLEVGRQSVEGLLLVGRLPERARETHGGTLVVEVDLVGVRLAAAVGSIGVDLEIEAHLIGGLRDVVLHDLVGIVQVQDIHLVLAKDNFECEVVRALGHLTIREEGVQRGVIDDNTPGADVDVFHGWYGRWALVGSDERDRRRIL